MTAYDCLNSVEPLHLFASPCTRTYFSEKTTSPGRSVGGGKFESLKVPNGAVYFVLFTWNKRSFVSNMYQNLGHYKCPGRNKIC